MSNKNCNTPPPHFWLKELPEDKDLCPNAIYFIKKGSKVEIYVTDKNSNEYTISDSIQSIISPNGTISISESGGVVGIDIAQNIIDQLNNVEEPITNTDGIIGLDYNEDFDVDNGKLKIKDIGYNPFQTYLNNKI